MKRVRTAGTQPERRVRRELHSRGMRYRVNFKELPGRPDLYIPRLQTALFVHGCFWHAHTCSRGRFPTANAEFWREKLTKNAERDRRTAAQLEALGVRVVTIWACQLSDLPKIAEDLKNLYITAAPRNSRRPEPAETLQ